MTLDAEADEAEADSDHQGQSQGGGGSPARAHRRWLVIASTAAFHNSLLNPVRTQR